MHLSENSFSQGFLQDLREGILTVFWIAYFAAVFLAYLLYARKTRQNEFVVLYLSMWAARGIPVMLGSVGRAMVSFFVWSLYLFLRTAWELRSE